MSTLGRKAMKKTLERLKEDAYKRTSECSKFFDGMQKRRGEMNPEQQKTFDVANMRSYIAIKSLLMYVQALEDYGYEIDEQWDKLLESIEQTQTDQKEGEEKTSYRV